MHNDTSAEGKRLRRMVASHPSDRVSWHNLAALEGDLGRVAESEAAARRAIALGITAPETRLVLARALQAQGRLDEAERMFEEALALRPVYVEAHRDLAQLVWMGTGDVALALRPLADAMRAAPHEPGLHLVRSIVLEFAGDLPAALAERALSVAPGSGAEITLCEALLAAGRPREAEATAAAAVARTPPRVTSMPWPSRQPPGAFWAIRATRRSTTTRPLVESRPL